MSISNFLCFSEINDAIYCIYTVTGDIKDPKVYLSALSLMWIKVFQAEDATCFCHTTGSRTSVHWIWQLAEKIFTESLASTQGIPAEPLK